MLQGIPQSAIPSSNIGKVNNRGFEVELNYVQPVTKDLTMQFRGTFNYNKNKVTYIDEPINPSDYVYRYRQTGFPMNTNWGYKIDYSNGNGFFNTQEELDEYLSQTTYSFGTPGLGDFKYMDLNEDGVVDEKDQVPLRYTKIPRITYGFSLGLDYKGIDFTIFFQGVSKYSHFSGTTQNVYEWTKEGTYYNYHKRAWTKERYENGEKITYPALHTGDNVNTRANDFFVFDRSFIPSEEHRARLHASPALAPRDRHQQGSGLRERTEPVDPFASGRRPYRSRAGRPDRIPPDENDERRSEYLVLIQLKQTP